MVKYRVYPTLLDEFQRYREGKITVQNLLNRINRVRDFDDRHWTRMQEGTRFEKAVVKGLPHAFDPAAVRHMQGLLPRHFQAQYLVKCVIAQSQIYGYADLVGEGRVIDIKTTRNFVQEKYLLSFQNIYLYALTEQGCTRMEYLVYDFQKVHHLVLERRDLVMDTFVAGIQAFEEFLEAHRAEITDTKIFVKTETSAPDLFE